MMGGNYLRVKTIKKNGVDTIVIKSSEFNVVSLQQFFLLFEVFKAKRWVTIKEIWLDWGYMPDTKRRQISSTMLSSLAAKGLIYSQKEEVGNRTIWKYCISPLGEKYVDNVLKKFPNIIEDNMEYLKERFRVREVKRKIDVDLRQGRKPDIIKEVIG